MSDDHLWDLWAEALIDFDGGGAMRCLRSPDPIDLSRRPTPIFVVTAYNPGGVSRDDAANEAAAGNFEVGAAEDGNARRSRDRPITRRQLERNPAHSALSGNT